jgi:hypothetical protein
MTRSPPHTEQGVAFVGTSTGFENLVIAGEASPTPPSLRWTGRPFFAIEDAGTSKKVLGVQGPADYPYN